MVWLCRPCSHTRDVWWGQGCCTHFGPSSCSQSPTCGSCLLAGSPEEKISGLARQISCINPGGGRVTDVVRGHPHVQHMLTAAQRQSDRTGSHYVLNCVVLSLRDCRIWRKSPVRPSKRALDMRERSGRGWLAGAEGSEEEQAERRDWPGR